MKTQHRQKKVNIKKKNDSRLIIFHLIIPLRLETQETLLPFDSPADRSQLHVMDELLGPEKSNNLSKGSELLLLLLLLLLSRFSRV